MCVCVFFIYNYIYNEFKYKNLYFERNVNNDKVFFCFCSLQFRLMLKFQQKSAQFHFGQSKYHNGKYQINMLLIANCYVPVWEIV